MSTAFTRVWANSPAELDRAFEKTVAKKVKQYPAAHIGADTGPQPCRLVPIMELDGWYPIPFEVKKLEEVLDILLQNGMTFDYTRRSQPGYCRDVMVRIA